MESAVDQGARVDTHRLERASSRGRRLRRLFVCVVCLAGLLYWGHGWMLRACVTPLVHRDAVTDVDVLIVLDGQGGYELARDWISQGDAKSLLLYQRKPSRVVALGVLPTHLELSRQMVASLEIPADKVEVLDPEIATMRQLLQIAVARQQSGERVGLVMTEWRSRLVFEELQRLIEQPTERPLLVLIQDPEVRADDWWRTRHGVRLVAMSWTRLLAHRWTDDHNPAPALEIEDFRRAAVAP